VLGYIINAIARILILDGDEDMEQGKIQELFSSSILQNTSEQAF
jgi:hypothetical protein